MENQKPKRGTKNRNGEPKTKTKNQKPKQRTENQKPKSKKAVTCSSCNSDTNYAYFKVLMLI